MARSSAWPKPIVVGVGLLACGLLIYVMRGVLSPVFFAFLLAYMFDPLVDRFEAMRLPRSVGIAIILSIVLVSLGLFLLLAAPAIASDVLTLVQQLPLALQRLLGLLEPTLAQVGVHVPGSVPEFLSAYSEDLATLAPSAVTPLRTLAAGLWGGTASALGALGAGVTVPIFAFYLLEDFDRIVARTHNLLPLDLRSQVATLAAEVDQVLGQFVRGQLTVMALLAMLYAGGYAAVGVKLAVPIGVVAGLLSFIPYAGSAIALGLALLMTALHYVGFGQVIAVIAVYAVIQLLEGFVITPKIVGDKLGLSPVWVLFALMVGGNLFGFLGVMLALPVAAVVKVFVGYGVDRYINSSLYQGVAAGPAEPSPARVRLRRIERRRRRRPVRAWAMPPR
ncbi:MAG: AI-2E family transporter [Myxococcales bacterium]|nr:AI-2E family transporter [Myxococcales bacterium]